MNSEKVSEEIKEVVMNFKEGKEQIMNKEKVSEELVKVARDLVAAKLPTIQDMVANYIEDNWTTAEKSWKTDAVKNIRVIRQSDDRILVRTHWEQDKDWSESEGQAEFIISISLSSAYSGKKTSSVRQAAFDVLEIEPVWNEVLYSLAKGIKKWKDAGSSLSFTMTEDDERIAEISYKKVLKLAKEIERLEQQISY